MNGSRLKCHDGDITLFGNNRKIRELGRGVAMRGQSLKDRKGVEIREGCTVRTKAFSANHQDYEYFKAVRVQRRLSVQRQDGWGNLRTYSVEYVQRWMRDDSMEVVLGAFSE